MSTSTASLAMHADAPASTPDVSDVSDVPAAPDAPDATAVGQPQQGHSTRDTMVRYLVQHAGLAEERARSVEVGVFNWALSKALERRVARNWRNPAFVLLYDAKARSVASNIDPESYVGNARLRARLHEAEFAPADLATMQPDHVFPERWREVVEAKVRRDEYITNAKTVAVTDQFRCGRCKRRECTYMELQTRSCDEPASLFIQCLACGNHWRLG